MGFMDKIKAGVGIGTAALVVEIKNKPSKRGEDLIAVIHITGGKNPQKMNYCVVDVRWLGKWEQPLADGRKVAMEGHAIFHRYNLAGSENVTLEPGKAYEFPMTVKIPMEGPLTTQDVHYDFGVRADIEEVSDPTFNTQFDITA